MNLNDTDALVTHVLRNPDRAVEDVLRQVLRDSGVPSKKANAVAKAFTENLVSGAVQVLQDTNEYACILERVMRDRGEDDVADSLLRSRESLTTGLHDAQAVMGMNVESLGAGGSLN